MTEAAIAKRNGPQTAAPSPQDDGYRAHVEATFARYDAVLKDRNALHDQLATAINALRSATETETLLRDEIASLRRQLEESNLRYLQAMAERAAYETLFASFLAMLRTFDIPAVPLIRMNADEVEAAVEAVRQEWQKPAPSQPMVPGA